MKPQDVARFIKDWKLFQDGLLTEAELAPPFIDAFQIDLGEREWEGLPEGYRRVIRNYLKTCWPDKIPDYFVIGDLSREERERMTRTRHEKARTLVTFLERLGELQLGPSTDRSVAQ